MLTRSVIKAAFRRLPKAIPALPFMLAAACAGSLWAATAQAHLIIANELAVTPSGSPIETYAFDTGGARVAFFFPTGASGVHSGSGVAVLGNKVYYTELPLGGFGSTDSIRIAPFNGGAGGADIMPPLPNPRPGAGIRDLDVANGVVYVLTGFPSASVQVFGLDPLTGLVVSGPVTISGPVDVNSDGFTVLPNGNFLINSAYFAPGSCTYNQFNPSTGAVIPNTTIVLKNKNCAGVATNGVHLFFSTDFDSFTETDLTGSFIVTKAVTRNGIADISLVTFGASGVPGKPSCPSQTRSDLDHRYGGLGNAARALGYANVDALKDAINGFCSFV
jgi:hypothetical protein